MKIRETMFDRIFNIFIITVLTFAAIVTLTPVINVLLISISPTTELVQYPGTFMRLPNRPTLDNYKYILAGQSPIITAMGITIFRTVVGTFLSLVITILTAYPLSKKNLPGGSKIMLFFFFTMLFNAGMIPTYLVVKNYGIIDTIWALIFPTALSVYNMIIMRTFYRSLPEELFEAAKIDGCNDFVVLVKIVLPLSLPVISSIGLFYAVTHWNSFFDSVLYILDRKLWPLQLYLREILLTASVSDMQMDNALSDLPVPPAQAIMCATIMISAIPIMMVYPFVQKHFVKGIMLGSVKG